VVLGGSADRRFQKGLSAAATDAEASGQVDDDEDEDMARVTNEALRATIRKSKEVLARHKVILEQVLFIHAFSMESDRFSMHTLLDDTFSG
jgi:starch synthase